MAVTRTEAIAYSDVWVRSGATLLRDAYDQCKVSGDKWRAAGGGRAAITSWEGVFRNAADRILTAFNWARDVWAEYILQRPFVEVSGSNAQTVQNNSLVDLSLDNPDLSDVTPGTDQLWIDFDPQDAGEQLFDIQAVNDTAKTVIVNGSLPPETGTFEWAIGVQAASYSQFFGAQDPGEQIVDGSPGDNRVGPVTVIDLINVVTHCREFESWLRNGSTQFTQDPVNNPFAPVSDTTAGGDEIYLNWTRATRSFDVTIMTVAEATNLITLCDQLVAEYEAAAGAKLANIDRYAVATQGAFT